MLILDGVTPVHIFWLPEMTDVGRGLTITSAFTGNAWQPPPVGVMVNVTVTGAAVVLVKVPVIFPDPLVPMPVTAPALFLVQL
jgi:hypothetical protein